MIITIAPQATSEERAQLMVQICRIVGNQHPITTTYMNKHEIIALDASQVDSQAQILLEQQQAVKSIHSLKTSYQLVSRKFQTESSCIEIGRTHGSNSVSIGGENGPIIIAGPDAV